MSRPTGHQLPDQQPPADQVDLTTLSSELPAVVDQTMQPTQASLWLRPKRPSNPTGAMTADEPITRP